MSNRKLQIVSGRAMFRGRERKYRVYVCVRVCVSERKANRWSNREKGVGGEYSDLLNKQNDINGPRTYSK